jgi:hypothetical protein
MSNQTELHFKYATMSRGYTIHKVILTNLGSHATLSFTNGTELSLPKNLNYDTVINTIDGDGVYNLTFNGRDAQLALYDNRFTVEGGGRKRRTTRRPRRPRQTRRSQKRR